MDFLFDWRIWTGVCFVVIVVPAIVLAGWLHRRHSQYAHIPGPPRDRMKTYGHTVLIFYYHIPMVWTVDREAVREILVVDEERKSPFVVKQMEKIFGVNFFGNSIPSEIDHQLWLKHRKILNLSFHKKNLKSMMVDLNNTADQLINKLKYLADGKTPIAMHDEIGREAQDAMGKVGYGQNINSINDRDSILSSDQTLVLKAWMEKRKSPTISISPFKAGYRARVRTSLKRMRDMFQQIMEKRTKSMAAGEHADDQSILSQIIRIKEQYPETPLETLIDNLVVFFIAGSENMQNVIGFTLIQLGLHPEVVRKVKSEVDDVLGSKAFMAYDDIGKLKYTDLVIKETMRLFPPICQIFKESRKGSRIGKFLLPEDTLIALSPYVSGRCEEFFPDALKFKPERFIEKTNRNHVYSTFPFSVGPRNCIGQNYAKIQIFLILSKLIQKFDYKLDPSQSFEPEDFGAIRPKGHSTCFLTPREATTSSTA